MRFTSILIYVQAENFREVPFILENMSQMSLHNLCTRCNFVWEFPETDLCSCITCCRRSHFSLHNINCAGILALFVLLTPLSQQPRAGDEGLHRTRCLECHSSCYPSAHSQVKAILDADMSDSIHKVTSDFESNASLNICYKKLLLSVTSIH
jgi:hypothetical protein